MAVVDVVVPVYGSADLTWACIVHLRAFPSGGLNEAPRVVLVDDASDDGGETAALGEWLEAFRAGTYVRLPENRGPHAAWNAGYARTATDPVFFVNNDVNVLPGCLAAMRVAMAVGDLDYVAARQLPSTTFYPVPTLAHARAHAKAGTEPGYFNSCFAVRRRVFDRVGPFDEQFRLCFGDVDFLERMRDAGMEPRVAQGAFAWHGVSATRRREFGAEGDVDRELADRARFEAKWAARPDVLARHPRQTREELLAGREACWR